MSIKPINIDDEMAKVEKLKSDFIQTRVSQFGETPEQAEKFYEEAIQSFAFAIYPKVLKSLFTKIKSLPT